MEQHGYLAQWLEWLASDQQVPGSNLGMPFMFRPCSKRVSWCQTVVRQVSLTLLMNLMLRRYSQSLREVHVAQILCRHLSTALAQQTVSSPRRVPSGAVSSIRCHAQASKVTALQLAAYRDLVLARTAQKSRAGDLCQVMWCA